MKRVESQIGPLLHNVLFATDFSPAAEAAFPYAATISDRYQSKLYVAHVINLESFDLLESESARITLKKAHDEAQREITQLLEPLHLPLDRYDIIVADGAIAEVLVDLIQTNHIDLAVVGTHGR